MIELGKFFILGLGSLGIAIFSTLTGGGASLLLLPLIGFFVGAKSIAPVMTLGIALSSSSRIYFFWKNLDWNLLAWLLPATLLGSLLGTSLFAYLSSEYLQIFIGFYLLASALHFLIQKNNPNLSPWKAWYFFPMGLVASFLSGLIGGVGPLMNTAYLRYGISKEGIVGTRSMNAVFLHITKLISYTYYGFVDSDILLYGMVVGIFSIVGNSIGKRYLVGMSDSLFQWILLLSMILSGSILFIRSQETLLDLMIAIKNFLAREFFPLQSNQ